ncbi:MAG: hypothetical protein N3A54_04575 [Patescibacteria group bacterium]|nr:hypothetical protein [Patescibacteria group bacterium]
MKHAIIFWLLGIVIVFGLYGQVTQFSPWVDDTKLMWASLHHVPSSLPYYNHPGLPLSFLVFSWLFGDHYVLWQIAGLGIKLVCAVVFGQFLFELTRSLLISRLAQIFFLVSPLGYEVYAAPIMNVSGLVAIPLFLFSTAWLRCLRGHHQWRALAFWFLLGMILDPGRMIFSILFMPLVVLAEMNRASIQFRVRRMYGMVGFVIIVLLLPFLVWWFTRFVTDSQVMIGLRGLVTAPHIYGEKLTRVNNLLAAIGNSYIFLFDPMSHNDQHTGTYERVYAVFGMILAGASVSFLFHGWRKRHRTMILLGCFLVWSFLFYLPHWFSEPRAPMSAPHRYLFLPGFGTVAVWVFVIASLRRPLLIVCISAVFISVLTIRAGEAVAFQARYRDMGTVEYFWQTIDAAAPIDQQKIVFVIEGNEPYRTQSLSLFGSDRFGLRRRISAPEMLPKIVHDPQDVERFPGYVVVHVRVEEKDEIWVR